MPNRLTAFWALLKPQEQGSHPAWVRAVLAALGVLVFVLVVGLYARHAWGMDELSDGFLVWTAMVLAIGVFSLTAASKKEKSDAAMRMEKRSDFSDSTGRDGDTRAGRGDR